MWSSARSLVVETGERLVGGIRDRAGVKGKSRFGRVRPAAEVLPAVPLPLALPLDLGATGRPASRPVYGQRKRSSVVAVERDHEGRSVARMGERRGEVGRMGWHGGVDSEWGSQG